uniref:Rho termination factor N-terminal domain-containing protein n=2 Tax=Tolypothrix TaxID=111782 RepID=A0A0C1N1U1_9CYAN
MLLATTFNQTQVQIDVLQAEIIRLQNEVASLQAHQQAVQSASKAAESALTQIRTALQMIESVSPNDVATFKDAIAQIFQGEVLALNASIDTDPQPEVAPSDSWTEIDEDIDSYYKANPVAETEDTTLETTAVVVEEDDYQDPEETLVEQKEDTSESQAELDFSSLTWVQIKRLASSMGIDINRRKRPHLEKALSDIGVTQSEIDQFLKG